MLDLNDGFAHNTESPLSVFCCNKKVLDAMHQGRQTCRGTTLVRALSHESGL